MSFRILLRKHRMFNVSKNCMTHNGISHSMTQIILSFGQTVVEKLHAVNGRYRSQWTDTCLREFHLTAFSVDENTRFKMN